MDCMLRQAQFESSVLLMAQYISIHLEDGLPALILRILVDRHMSSRRCRENDHSRRNCQVRSILTLDITELIL